MRLTHTGSLLVVVAALTGGCAKKDANELAARDLERNKKKLAEIQKALKSASEESVALTKKIETLSAEVSALQGSDADKAK